LPHRLQPHAVCVVTTLIFFLADLLLPRGATPAIGYCFVPVLARATGQRPFLLAITGVCTILTWIGYALEPAGVVWWVSVFERAMVTGVLWLTLLLVWRRMEAEVAIARQAQELRDAVRELQRSNVELENFASVVSHDIRGPLNSIDLLTQLISSQASIKSDMECSEWLGSIRSEITRMSSLIRRLLAYGRVGAGEVKLSDCDFESVLRSVRQTLRAELEEVSAQITNDVLPTARADPALMAELLQNLIENSVKYHRQTPLRVHFSANRTPEGWLFSVEDNGVGMRPQDCARVFEPFYRAEGVHMRGVGLGLATCKRIVERHDGRIAVQSSAGLGSTFTFLIPSHPALAHKNL